MNPEEIDLEDIGLNAVDNFINSWNSRDAGTWAESLNFPHVRPSPGGQFKPSPSAEAYANAMDYGRVVDSGWDHSEWDYKQVVHTSPVKIHVAGQWTRYNKAGDKILTTPVTYVVTNVEGHWGVQSRFGSDFAGDEDTSGLEMRAFRHIESFIHNHNNANRDACAELLNYPHYAIGIGELNETASDSEFNVFDAQIELDQSVALQSGRRSINLALDLNINNASGKHRRQAVMLLTNVDNHLGIQAWSILDPDMKPEAAADVSD